MGKRVSVKRQQVPTIKVGKLRDSSETGLKMLGLYAPAVVYALLLGGGYMVSKTKPGPVVLNLGAWLVLGLVVTVFLGGKQKRDLLKQHPRSKVTGSAHPELRMLLNRLCRLLEIKQPPELFVIESAQVVASARGYGKPYLVLSTRLTESLAPNELEAMFAALLGQVKAGNVRWRTFITVLKGANGLLKAIGLPYLLMANLMQNYREASYLSGDRIALLVLDGDYHLMARTVLKVVAMSSDELPEQQRQELDAFLNKQGVEAKAEDVQHSYLLGLMVRVIPGLRERLDNINNCGGEPWFQEQLAVMRQRVEMLQPAARG